MVRGRLRVLAGGSLAWAQKSAGGGQDGSRLAGAWGEGGAGEGGRKGAARVGVRSEGALAATSQRLYRLVALPTCEWAVRRSGAAGFRPRWPKE